MKKIFLAILLAFSLSPRLSSLDSEPLLDRYLVSDGAAMPQVSDHFEVLAKTKAGYEVIVPQASRDAFLKLAPAARLLESDIDAKTRDVSRGDLRGYHNLASVETHLKKLEKDYFDLATLETYGSSKEGRPLYALRLEGRKLALKKEVMVTSATHGDELITVEVTFGLIDQLLAGYGNDARLTEILDSHIIYYIPVVNPDGYFRRTRYANGVDPNREYPWPEMPTRNPNPCIKAIMDFTAKHNFAGGLDYHSAIGTYMYPWSYTTSPVTKEDQVKFRAVAKKMAATNGYAYGQIPEVVYIAKGASADYYYWKGRTFAMAVEISGTNNPPASQIEHYTKENAEALWIFLESI